MLRTRKYKIHPGKRREDDRNEMGSRVPIIHEKYWTESGRGDGQGDVEKEDHQSYRQPYIYHDGKI